MAKTKIHEPFRPVLINLSIELIGELDTHACTMGCSRSHLVRQLLDRGLEQAATVGKPMLEWELIPLNLRLDLCDPRV